ncbi:hypothetical protein D9M68_484490 [compost metagenome]
MLARQDALEEADELGRHRHVHHEVGAGEGEDDRDFRFIGDQRVDLDAAVFAVQQRDHQRPLFVAGVDAPHQVGALVAEQRRGEELDAQLRVLAHPVRQVFAQQGLEAPEVAGAVIVGHVEAVVVEDRREYRVQPAFGAVAAGLRRALVGAQRGPGGVDEHAAVADQVVAEQVAENRVVPGLGQLIVETQVDQADVGALHQGPELHVQQLVHCIGRAQPFAGFADLHLVEGDPLRRRLLRGLPLRQLESPAGAVGDLAEMLTVVVETFEDQSGDAFGGPLLRHVDVSAAETGKASLARKNCAL